MHWRTEDVSEKGFITHLLCKWPLYTLEAAEPKYTCAISKHMKTPVWFRVKRNAELFL